MPVTIYTSFGWGPCIATKSWLQKNKIEYIEKSVGSIRVRDELLALGYRTTPVVISDKGTVVGYSPAKLSEALLWGVKECQ